MNRRLLIVGLIVLFGGVFAESQTPAVPNPAPANGSAQPSSERLNTSKDGFKPPKLIYSTEPSYPPKEREADHQGTVELSIAVGADGLPRDVKIERTLSPEFDEAAIEAVKKWKFWPATKDGVAVASKINVQVTFSDGSAQVSPLAIYTTKNGVTPPQIIYHPDPKYPKKERKAGHQGTVVLRVVVGPDGLPRSAQIARSLSPEFDEAAMDAVINWKFSPATKDGQSVATKVNVEVNFRLR